MKNTSFGLLIFIIFVIVGLIIFLMVKNNKPKLKLIKTEPESESHKYKEKPLMSGNEFEFFDRLVKALPQYYIFPQVSMGAVLEPDNADPKRNISTRGTFNQKRIDYVIFDNNKRRVVAIVELDDKTHNKAKDEKRDAMLIDAGYKNIRFTSTQKPKVEDIAEMIKKL